jgi:predicted RNase H-like HicB family nuclease
MSKLFTFKRGDYSKTFRFKNGINWEDYIRPELEDGYILWEFPPFGCSSLCWGKTREELEEQIAEELDFVYHNYAMAKEGILHPSAFVVRDNFWKCVEVVEENT